MQQLWVHVPSVQFQVPQMSASAAGRRQQLRHQLLEVPHAVLIAGIDAEAPKVGRRTVKTAHQGGGCGGLEPFHGPVCAGAHAAQAHGCQ